MKNITDDDKKARDVSIRIHYANDEYEIVSGKADKAGLSVSQYIRSVSLTSKYGSKVRK